MKILSAQQTREADAITIRQEPVDSIDLMERASTKFVQAFTPVFSPHPHPVYVFCGPGNNGGDGLAIARLLAAQEYQVRVFTVQAQGQVSDDFATNRDRWQEDYPIHSVDQISDIPEIPAQAIIIDGLFGSGLSRPVTGLLAEVVAAINQAPATVVAIDIPSGLYADQPTPEEASVVRADYTFTFQLPKLSFLLPHYQGMVGQWKAVDIGLNEAFLERVATPYYYTDETAMRGVRRPRDPASHKGNYGKALIIAGSYGKMGAAVLGARAAKHGGVGLLTMHVPECGYTVLQTAVPEAMVMVDRNPHHFSQLEADVLDQYDTLGIGPGLGTDEATLAALRQVLPAARERGLSLVMDADALNLCGQHRELLQQLPERTILTPHPKEFERLTEPARDDFHRLQLLRSFCQTYQVHVVLKGGHTAVGTPDGDIHFNSTGNPGMATGGSGDVLTGLLTALVAQPYTPLEAARLGVYLHGLAGDLAAAQMGQEALTASDLITRFGQAFQQLG